MPLKVFSMVNNHLKIATPISDLFKKKEEAEIISNHSDCLECRDHSIFSDRLNQELFHCELQPIHKFGNKEIEYLEKIKFLKTDLKLISFHLGSCYKNPILKNGRFYPNGLKVSRDQLLENAKNNLILIKKIFGSNIKIAVENNNHYKTEAYDFITCPDFISEVVKLNDINFLYDIAHSKISSFNFEIPLENYENKLPFDKLIQIHIAKPGFNETGEIYDKHDIPTKKEFSEAILLANKYSNVNYLTIEYYKSPSILVDLLRQLKSMLN